MAPAWTMDIGNTYIYAHVCMDSYRFARTARIYGQQLYARASGGDAVLTWVFQPLSSSGRSECCHAGALARVETLPLADVGQRQRLRLA